jgi:PAS domain S-box-containing protein
VDGGDLQRKADIAELLLAAARHLGESPEPERVYERFHELLGEVVRHDGIVVSSYDPADNLIRCEYAWVEGTEVDPDTLPPLPLNRSGGGMQSRVIVTGEPALFNDVEQRVEEAGGVFYNVDREGHVEKIPESGPSGTKAAMMVPVKEQGSVVGVVQLMSDRGQYSPDDLELFEALVAQMAASVRSVRLQKERRRLEAAETAARAVAAERERAAHVLDAVGDGIFLLDAEGVVRLWNNAATRATGLDADVIVGKPPADTIREWPTLADRIPVAGPGETPRSVTLPVEVRGRDLWLSFVAVRTAEGVIYAFRDVTAEQRLEEEKSDFVATISHELRTPMAAVYGAAQTLLRRDIDLGGPAGRKLLEMIATQSARLSQITEEILLTNQLDRGEVAIEREAIDVGALVRATVDAMTSHVPDTARIAVEIAADLGKASADADRLQQVLVNLLDNAVKYGGGAPVTVSASGANGVVRIAVSDTGAGISVPDQERIFEKFFRADPGLTRSPSGTGLGLYISRELVRRMGGRLEVQSALGAGTTFVVELPRA